MPVIPVNSLVEPLHRDVICHSSSPRLACRGRRCWGNALMVVSLAQSPAIGPAPSGQVERKRTEERAHPHLNLSGGCTRAGLDDTTKAAYYPGDMLWTESGQGLQI